MDAPNFLFLFLLSTLSVCSSGVLKDDTKKHDLLNFPTTTPVTNPATSTPAIVTVPSTTPVTVTPTPASTPVTVSPATNNPVTNPVTTPTVAPPATTNAPAGQRWCVAKSGAPEKNIQTALDYACGIGGADCSAIQQGGSCYNPLTLQNHASYAFNTYYQRNPLPTSCDFGGTAVITNTNPSSASCIFATSAASTLPTPTPTTAYPVTTNPALTPPITVSPVTTYPTPTPTTASSTGAVPTGQYSGTPPAILNPNNPDLGGATTGFGDGSPVVNTTSSVSASTSMQPLIGCIVVVASIIAGGMVLDM